ncbi:MAG: acyl--CoA ligase [Alphaproteobacteria bacterium]|nr:acyl--CoA ligase [Alphaproteobacteria bacterium]
MPLTGHPLKAPFEIAGLLRPEVQAKPDETALVSAERRWTWRELDHAVANVAAGLRDLGLTPGTRVASLMPNRDALLIHYLACLRAGLVATPLNYRYTAPEIDHALEVSGAAVLFAHAERDPDIADSRLAGQLSHGLISYGADDGRRPAFEELVAREASDTTFAAPLAEDPAVIFFTSGSTGKPKGVTHSHNTLGWMFAACAHGFELTAGDVMMPGSSISHLGGFLFSFAALSVGARVIVVRTFDGDEIIPLLRSERPTVLCMLPAALLRFVGEHRATREDFASLRLVRSGGDKVPAELEKEFTELTGFPIDEGYGMTEIGLATLSPPSDDYRLGSVGRPVHGFHFSIRDEQDREVAHGVEGRLWAKTPTSTVGYWDNPQATQEVYREGWLDTGDVMKSDEDGFLWFCGRKKQIIVHDGSNICPQEVEEALLEHPAVAAVGAIGVYDLLHGENVRAYVALEDGATPPPVNELIRFARDRVGYKAPEEIEFLDEIPLNPTGKTDRLALKRLAAEKHEVGSPSEHSGHLGA